MVRDLSQPSTLAFRLVVRVWGADDGVIIAMTLGRIAAGAIVGVVTRTVG